MDEDQGPSTGGFGGRSCLVNDSLSTMVSLKLGKDHKKLAFHLGLSETDMEIIELDEGKYGADRVAFKMLETWKRKEGRDATNGRLIQYLEAINRRDIVQKIEPRATMAEDSGISAKRRRLSSTPAEFSSTNYVLTLSQLQAKFRRRYRGLMMKGLPWMRNVHLTMDKHFVQLEMTKENEDDADSPKLNIELEELFQSSSAFEEEPLRILVEGEPGFGKTTVATKLCYDYAHQKDYIKHFDIVFFSCLRNFTGDLEEMLCSAAFVTEKQRVPLLNIINDESVKTLLVLDGYDELPRDHADSILDLIRGEILPHITLIVTTRPGRFSSNTNCINKHFVNMSQEVDFDMTQVWDIRTKIIGISEKRQVEFICKHLSNFPSDEKQYIQEQITQMKDKGFLTSDFLKCPLFILMIVLLITEKESATIQQLNTRTELYKRVLNLVMRRYLTKLDPSASRSDLFSFDVSERPLYVDLMTQLGEFSLGAINSKTLSFTREQIVGENSTKDCRILELGIITKSISVRGFLEEECYQPIHKSLLEFAAAYFLWIQFRTGRLEEWKVNVCNLRPINVSDKSSLLIPFLAGLMKDEAVAIFEALSPYAAEYSAKFDSLVPVLCETKMTDSILKSLIPFLPQSWRTYWSYNSISTFALPNKVLMEGLEVGQIDQLVWYLTFPVCFKKDIRVNRLLLLVEDEICPFSSSQFENFECKYLMCEFLSQNFIGDKWKDLLFLFSSIQFKRISFWLWNSTITSLYLPLIYEALMNGELQDAKVQGIQCEISDERSKLVDMLTDLVQKKKVEGLDIRLDFQPSKQYFSNLFTHLNRLELLSQHHSHRLTVDLNQLCNGGEKTYQSLRICSDKLECKAHLQNHNGKIELLELPGIDYTTSIAELFQSYQIAAFCGNCSILVCESRLFHEFLTELNIMIKETFFSEELFSHLSKFQNLQVLTLTLTSFKYQSQSVQKFLDTSVKCLPKLRGFEVDWIEKNLPLTMDITDGLAKYLQQSYPQPLLPAANSSLPMATLPTSRNSSLQYILLKFWSNPDLNFPSSNDESEIRVFVSLLSRLKRSLKKGELARLDIIIVFYSVMEFMARFKAKGFSSFVEVFPPSEGFFVEHDFVGMKDDDSIQNKKVFTTMCAWSHRFSVTCSKNNETVPFIPMDERRKQLDERRKQLDERRKQL